MAEEKIKLRNYGSGDVKEFDKEKGLKLVEVGNWEIVKDVQEKVVGVDVASPDRPLKMRDVMRSQTRWRR